MHKKSVNRFNLTMKINLMMLLLNINLSLITLNSIDRKNDEIQ